MEDHLNRAAWMRRQRLLVLMLATCFDVSLQAGEAVKTLRMPQRIATPAAKPEVKISERDPALFVHEPTDDSVSLTAKYVTNRSVAPFAPNSPVMPGYSVASLRQAAVKSLDESAARLAHRANLSASAAATDALQLIAQSLDTAHGGGQASAALASAMVAIREAEDFVGRYGSVDATAMTRMVRSHETTALKSADTSQLTGLVAADIYLDAARQALLSIACNDPLAANAIGLLAASYRQRAPESSIALATSVHLMRAAVSASPNDRGLALELASVLAEAKLQDESQLAFAYAMKLSSARDSADLPTENSAVIAVVSGTKSNDMTTKAQQAVRIEQLSPEAFASASRVEAGPVGTPSSNQSSRSASVEAVKDDGNSVSRVFKSMMRGRH